MSHQIILVKNTNLDQVISLFNDSKEGFIYIKEGKRFSNYLLLNNGEHTYFSEAKNINFKKMISLKEEQARKEYNKSFQERYSLEEYIQLIISCDLIPSYFIINNEIISSSHFSRKEQIEFFVSFFKDCSTNDIISVFDLY